MSKPEFTFRLSPSKHQQLREQLTDKSEGLSPSAQVETATSTPLALAIFLEREPSKLNSAAGDSVWRGAFNKLISAVTYWGQGDPHMLHVELILVTANGELFNFATYVGDHARWRPANDPYYLEGEWRALPIDATQAVGTLASECSRAVGTPYSLLRYVFSTPLCGWGSRQLSDRVGSPAHCASLTARLVRTALGSHGKQFLPLDSARYSPSSLYNAICDNASSIRFETRRTEREESATDLISGSDDSLATLNGAERATALLEIARSVRNAMVRDKRTLDPACTRDLAWAAIRCGALKSK